MTMQTVTLNMPESLYQRARRAADALKRPVAEIIVETLNVVLPPLDDVSLEMADELVAMKELPNEKLWEIARRVMPAKHQARHRALSAAQRERQLTTNLWINKSGVQ